MYTESTVVPTYFHFHGNLFLKIFNFYLYSRFHFEIQVFKKFFHLFVVAKYVIPLH
jgi:hypothetical protein